MKITKALFLILLTFFILCCDGPEEKTGFEINVPEEKEIDEETVMIEEEPFEETASDGVLIEDLPSNWIMLSENTEITEAETDEGYSIYKMCFSEQQALWIESEKGDDWIATILYGQESEDFFLTNFEATVSEKELYMVVDGTFTLTSVYDNRVKEIVFWWNKDISFACFEGLYEKTVFYVPEENKDEYELVTEICEEPY